MEHIGQQADCGGGSILYRFKRISPDTFSEQIVMVVYYIGLKEFSQTDLGQPVDRLGRLWLGLEG